MRSGRGAAAGRLAGAAATGRRRGRRRREHRHQGQDAERGGDCCPCTGFPLGGREDPGGRALAGAPARDVERDRGGHQDHQRQREQLLRRAVHAGGAGGEQEHAQVPADHEEGPDHDRANGGRLEQDTVGPDRGGAESPCQTDGTVPHHTAAGEQQEAHGRRASDGHRGHRHLHRRGEGQQHRECDRRLDHLARDALPEDGAQSAADVADVDPVPQSAMDVANDAAGQDAVEELRAVVGPGRIGQRHADPERTGHGAPAPGRADRGHGADGEGGQERAGAEPARPSRKGPGPTRQTTTAMIRTPPRRRAPAHARRLTPLGLRPSDWQHGSSADPVQPGPRPARG